MATFGAPKVTVEKEIIPPEDLIAQAGKFRDDGYYSLAERTCANAMKSAKGSPDIGILMSRVKNVLKSVYSEWAGEYSSSYDFHEAEPVLLKKQRICEKGEMNLELINMYGIWGRYLGNDGNPDGAIVTLLKKLKLEYESGRDINETTLSLSSQLYATKKRKNEALADALFVSDRKRRIKVLISAIIPAAASLISTLYAPIGLLLYVFSFSFMEIDAQHAVAKDPSQRRSISRCTFLTVAALAVALPAALSDGNGAILQACFIIAMLINFSVLAVAVKRFSLFLSYRAADPLKLMEKYKGPEVTELRIKNKPLKAFASVSVNNDETQKAMNKAGFLAGRLIAKAIPKFFGL